MSQDELPKDLEDTKCSICNLKYGDEDPDNYYVEYPVRLPCNHIVGKHCALIWLSPGKGKGNGNTCPLCRYKLFEPWPPQLSGTITTHQRGDGITHEQWLANRRADFERHLRAIQDYGYSLGPWMHWNIDGVEHRSWQIAAGRRKASLHERDLYTEFIRHGVEFQYATDPISELLNYRQDQELFAEIRCRGAFRKITLNEEFRYDPLGRQLSDYEIYEKLRNVGAYWDIEGYWMQNEEQRLFPEDDEDEPEIFEELLVQGALRTPGINQTFRTHNGGMTDYHIFRRVIEMGITWDGRRRVWTNRTGEALFGDTVHEPIRRGRAT